MNHPALRYFGGKWRLAPWIIRHFPEHTTYVEPFGGGASVLLRKPPAPVEIYNDLSGTVVNFFRVLREHPAELIKQLELTPFAVDEYNACKEQVGDDVERARRFFVWSWGGHVGTQGDGRNRGWRRTPDRNVARQMRDAARALEDVAKRFANVAIDAVDWRTCLNAYDRDTALFYVDPPYLPQSRRGRSPSDGYGKYEMRPEEHQQLLAGLKAVKGSVVLSGYGSDLYDQELSEWKRHEHKTSRFTEVLWIKRRSS